MKWNYCQLRKYFCVLFVFEYLFYGIFQCFFFFFQSSHQNKPRSSARHSTRPPLLQRFLGNTSYPQWLAQILPTPLRAHIPSQLRHGGSGPLGLPPLQRPVTRVGHGFLHTLRIFCVFSQHSSHLDGWITFRLTSHTHGGCSWSCWTCRCWRFPVLSVVTHVLHEVLQIQGQEVVLVLVPSTCSSFHAHKRAWRDCSHIVCSL